MKADAGAGVEYIDNELIHVLSGEDLIARREDGVLAPFVETPSLAVRKRGGPLDPNEAADERREGAIATDGVVLDGSLGLGTP